MTRRSCGDVERTEGVFRVQSGQEVASQHGNGSRHLKRCSLLVVDGLLHLSLTVYWLLVNYFEPRRCCDGFWSGGPDSGCSVFRMFPAAVTREVTHRSLSMCVLVFSVYQQRSQGFLWSVLARCSHSPAMYEGPIGGILVFIPRRHSHNPLSPACAAISLCLSSYSPARCSALCESVLTADQPSQVQTLMRSVRCGWKKRFWVIFIVRRGDFIYVAGGFRRPTWVININNNLWNWCREGKFTGSANIPECRNARVQM